MDLGLKGKVVLVTGASAGIGKATAKKFMEEGADLMICSRNQENIDKAREEIAMLAPKQTIHAIAADIHTGEGREKFVNEALIKFKRIDILVNNTMGAAINMSPTGQVPDASWKVVFEGKLFAYISLINLVLPQMVKQKYGRIVSVVGSSGKEPTLELIGPGLVNAGLMNYTKGMADAFAKDNILIHSVNPGHVSTSRLQQWIDIKSRQLQCSPEEIIEKMVKHIPVKRLGQPDDVANLIVFLTSDCATYLTGLNINVDGGMSHGMF